MTHAKCPKGKGRENEMKIQGGKCSRNQSMSRTYALYLSRAHFHTRLMQLLAKQTAAPLPRTTSPEPLCTGHLLWLIGAAALRSVGVGPEWWGAHSRVKCLFMARKEEEKTSVSQSPSNTQCWPKTPSRDHLWGLQYLSVRPSQGSNAWAFRM